ncbi:unnamed protein product [Parnassius mnemosyne]|uniref:Uncharacterized protein n=1 Tax=Parnassius mnemosyne TaxID=213953 RepID=A0AAV1M2N9_9NEOP
MGGIVYIHWLIVTRFSSTYMAGDFNKWILQCLPIATVNNICFRIFVVHNFHVIDSRARADRTLAIMKFNDAADEGSARYVSTLPTAPLINTYLSALSACQSAKCLNIE